MAKRKTRGKQKKSRKQSPVWQWIGIAAASVIIIWAAVITLWQDGGPSFRLPTLPALPKVQAAVDELYGHGELAPEPLLLPNGELEVHMIDVGQALSVFIRAPSGECALIDAGDRDDAQRMVDYLRKQKVEKLDLLIATHPHADHIGGMAKVVGSVDVDKVIMARLPESTQPTTKAYTDLLEAIAMRRRQITPAKPGTSYAIGDARLTIEGPVADYEDLNNTSVVSRIVYGGRSFLIEGDAEGEAEADMLKDKRVLRADVLVVGHHGSSTSTSPAFLKAVRPHFAGISCGTGNSYGHPHSDTVKRLENDDCTIYRTDLDGTVIFYTDGKNIRIVTEKGGK